jgi:hypothetical protein
MKKLWLPATILSMFLSSCSHPSTAPVNASPKPTSGESQGTKSGFTESTGGDNARDATGSSTNPADPYGRKPPARAENSDPKDKTGASVGEDPTHR